MNFWQISTAIMGRLQAIMREPNAQRNRQLVEELRGYLEERAELAPVTAYLERFYLNDQQLDEWCNYARGSVHAHANNFLENYHGVSQLHC